MVQAVAARPDVLSVTRFGRRPKTTRGGAYAVGAASGSDSAGS